jgi:hypothetical protein
LQNSELARREGGAGVADEQTVSPLTGTTEPARWRRCNTDGSGDAAAEEPRGMTGKIAEKLVRAKGLVEHSEEVQQDDHEDRHAGQP